MDMALSQGKHESTSSIFVCIDLTAKNLTRQTVESHVSSTL